MKANDTNKEVVTRFAPSPTGYLHVGGIRTALYAWLWAKKNDGRFILRLEDTDKEREVEGSEDHIKQSLEWLGLNWDEYFVQSERLSVYNDYAEKLIKKGLAYADPYSEEQLDIFRKKAEEEKKPFLFRDHRPDNPSVWDRKTPLRFRTTLLKKYTWNDATWGELTAGEEALDDFILIKSDGFPTYNFAHIVDDIEMSVTHVMRGQEFISSTPKFISLYEALEKDPPIFVTLPPIMGPDGKKKLSKRDGAKDILDYRNDGYLPEAIINYLALLGWNPGDNKEIFKREELIGLFDISKIQRSGAKLDDEKLDWVNKEHIKMLSVDDQKREIGLRLKEFKVEESMVGKIAPIVIDRIHKWSDIEEMKKDGDLQYFFNKPDIDTNMLSWKGSTPHDVVKKHLQWILKTLEVAPNESFNSSEDVKKLIFDYATDEGRGEVLWPFRVALSGKEKSPDPFTLSYILGKEETLSRINTVLKNIG